MTLAISISDGASLIDNARVVIYDRNMFLIQVTGVKHDQACFPN
jgi:hypothetical protein